MTNELAVRRETSLIHNFDDAQRAATAMAKSGFFQDSREAAQALVKVLAGQELGFGPFASMTGVFIIQGRPSIGANLMASAVKGSGRYDYRVKTNTDTLCEIEYFENGKSLGVSTFTIEDAKKAQTKNLDKFPRNMLFARAMSNGVRWYCPDAFNGNAVYTPEELGADVDIEGNVIPGSFKEVTPEPTKEIVPETKQPEKQPEPIVVDESDPYAGVCDSEGRPYALLSLKDLSFHATGLVSRKNRTDEDNRKLEAVKHYMAIKRAAGN